MVKIFIRNNRGFILTANHWFEGSESIIIMSPGFTGDKSMGGRFDKLAEKFSLAGYSVIAYDYCGCGESDDEILIPDNAVQDLQSIISYARHRGYKNIGLFGQSYGTLVSLRACNDEVRTMVLVGALTGSIRYTWENYYSKEQIKELRESGHMRIFKDQEDVRNMVIIDKSMLLDFEQIDQEKLIERIGCPLLLVHGDRGEEELLLLENSRKAMKLLKKDSRLEIIEGANHKFNDHLNIVSDLAIKWFAEYL